MPKRTVEAAAAERSGCSPIEQQTGYLITLVIGIDRAPLREEYMLYRSFFWGTITKSFYLLLVEISNQLMNFRGRIGPFQSQTQAQIFGAPIHLPPGPLRTASDVEGGKERGPVLDLYLWRQPRR